MSQKSPAVLDLMMQIRSGRMTRRQVLHRGLALGLSSPIIMSLLAACGGDDDDDTQSGDATATLVPVGQETSTPGDEEPTPTSGGSANQSDNTTLTVLLEGGAPDLDPHSAYDERASLVFFGVYELMLKLKGESTFDFEPMLAREWESNDDLTEYTFTIDEGILFQDGSTCDAQAIVDSFTRYLEQGLGPVDVIGRFIDDPASQMTAVDATTVRFTMNKPEPLFLPAMASQYGPFVLSPTAMEENATPDDEWAHEFFLSTMVGTGPYIVTEHEPNELFVLGRFEDYHGEAPFFDQINIRVVPESVTRRQLMESGDADGDVASDIEDRAAMKENADLQVIDYDSTQTSWMLLNYALLSLDERLGFCYAFPYTEVVENVLRGYAKQQGPIADTIVGYDANIPLFETDLDQAREHFEAASASENSYEFLYQTGDVSSRSNAQLFQANLAEIGVTLDLREIDPSAMNDLLFGDTPAEERPHIISWGWWPDYNDSYNQLYPNFYSGAFGSEGANALGYANADVDELLDQAAAAATEEELIDLTGQIVQIMMWDDPAAVFYAQVIRSTVLRSDIRGFVPNGIYIATYNFTDMWREA